MRRAAVRGVASSLVLIVAVAVACGDDGDSGDQRDALEDQAADVLIDALDAPDDVAGDGADRDGGEADASDAFEDSHGPDGDLDGDRGDGGGIDLLEAIGAPPFVVRVRTDRTIGVVGQTFTLSRSVEHAFAEEDLHYAWDFEGGTSADSPDSDVQRLTFDTPGEYLVQVVATNPDGEEYESGAVLRVYSSVLSSSSCPPTPAPSGRSWRTPTASTRPCSTSTRPSRASKRWPSRPGSASTRRRASSKSSVPGARS